MKALVIFDSKYGQTKKIAGAIADELKRLGNSVTLQNAQEDQSPPAAGTELVVVGGPVYKGSYSARLKQWTHRNHNTLNRIPSYFFSVCLGILEKNEKVRVEEQKIVDRFLKETGFLTCGNRIFAGALPYSKYNVFIRFIMKRIAKKAGGDTDTSKDYEYTDWKDVKRFVESLLAQQKGSGPRVVAECPVVGKD